MAGNVRGGMVDAVVLLWLGTYATSSIGTVASTWIFEPPDGMRTRESYELLFLGVLIGTAGAAAVVSAVRALADSSRLYRVVPQPGSPPATWAAAVVVTTSAFLAALLLMRGGQWIAYPFVAGWAMVNAVRLWRSSGLCGMAAGAE